jgi:dihydroorotate dehydrogenase electron transfer subunit
VIFDIVQQFQATITAKEVIAPAWWQLTVNTPAAANLLPGQFLFAQSGGSYLRRALFPRITGPEQLAFTLRPTPDPGLVWLNARAVGETIDVIGPLGRGFPLPETVSNLLLITDGQNISALLGLIDRALASNKAVTMMQVAGHNAAILPAGLLSPAVELLTITNDPYFRQLATQLQEALLWTDMVGASGSPPLYRFLKNYVSHHRPGQGAAFLYGIAPTSMFVCGLGLCGSCTVNSVTRSDLQLACLDGPVLDLMIAELSPETGRKTIYDD